MKIYDELFFNNRAYIFKYTITIIIEIKIRHSPHIFSHNLNSIIENHILKNQVFNLMAFWYGYISFIKHFLKNDQMFMN